MAIFITILLIIALFCAVIGSAYLLISLASIIGEYFWERKNKPVVEHAHREALRADARMEAFFGEPVGKVINPYEPHTKKGF